MHQKVLDPLRGQRRARVQRPGRAIRLWSPSCSPTFEVRIPLHGGGGGVKSTRREAGPCYRHGWAKSNRMLPEDDRPRGHAHGTTADSRAQGLSGALGFHPGCAAAEARRQKKLDVGAVPISASRPRWRHPAPSAGQWTGSPTPQWACYHTSLHGFEQEGLQYGIVDCVVGAAFAVLVAEEPLRQAAS
jgi:hypothetical protein